MTIGELAPFINLVLIPIFVYIVKLERQLAVLGAFKHSVDKKLDSIDVEIKAVHKRMDHVNIAHASASRG